MQYLYICIPWTFRLPGSHWLLMLSPAREQETYQRWIQTIFVLVSYVVPFLRQNKNEVEICQQTWEWELGLWNASNESPFAHYSDENC